MITKTKVYRLLWLGEYWGRRAAHSERLTWICPSCPQNKTEEHGVCEVFLFLFLFLFSFLFLPKGNVAGVTGLGMHIFSVWHPAAKSFVWFLYSRCNFFFSQSHDSEPGLCGLPPHVMEQITLCELNSSRFCINGFAYSFTFFSFCHFLVYMSRALLR